MAKKTSKVVATIFTFLSFILFFVFVSVGEAVGFSVWLVSLVIFYVIYKNVKAIEKEAKADVVPEATEPSVEEEVSQRADNYPVSVVVKTDSSEQPVAGVKILLTGPGVRETKTTDDLGSTAFFVPAGEYTVSTETISEYERSKPEHLSVDRESIVNLHIKRKVCKVQVIVKDAKVGVPIPGVSVSLGELRAITGNEGEVYFSDVPVGERKLSVEGNSDLYESLAEERELEERTNTFEIALNPKSFLNPEQKVELGRIRKTLDDALDNLPGYCDKGIPGYIHSAWMAALAIIERVSNSPIYFMDSSIRPSDAINQMIEVVDKVCREITEVILSERNIDLYAAIEKARIFSSPPQFVFEHDKSISVYDDKLKRLLSDPEGFSNICYNELQKKITMVDGVITAKMLEFTTTPVSGIWRISKELMKYAEMESGLKKGVLIFMAELLLDYARMMFEVPEIMRRLKMKPF